MKTIYNEFKSGMENIYNSFFISFLALKPLMERPIFSDFMIPIKGFTYNVLQASQLNQLGDDSINEYVNSIRRHALNDIVICYERYASLMYMSHNNELQRKDSVLSDDRSINAAKFENLDNRIYVDSDKCFFQQLRRLRNSIVHFNGVYTKTNPLNYTFDKNTYNSLGHEGENITIELDSIMYIYQEVYKLVSEINKRYFNLFPIN